MALGSFDPDKYGIFADSALGDMDQLKVEQTQGGVQMTRACDRCITDRKIEISWEELACIAAGIMPQQMGRPDIFTTHFQYFPQFQCISPVVNCPCDQRHPLIFQITPQDANKWVQQAKASGIMHPQTQANIYKWIFPTAQRMRGGGG